MTKECAPTFRLDYFRSQHHDVPVNDLGASIHRTAPSMTGGFSGDDSSRVVLGT